MDPAIDILSFGEPLIAFYPPPGRSMAEDVPAVKTWGGDTSNVALAAAKLGLRSAYLTRVGDEVFGRSFLELWKRNGVLTDFVQIDPLKKTGLYFVSFEGQRHLLTYYRADSAAANFDIAAFDLSVLKRTRILHLSGISQGIGEKARDASFALMRAAKDAGALVSYDVNYRPALWPKDEARTAAVLTAGKYADILEITDDEMEILGWGTEAAEIPRLLPGPKYHIVKRGAAGAWLSGPEGQSSVPAFAVPVKDTVGAGDAFDTGFVASLLAGKGIAAGGRFAAAVAALVCTGTGPLEKQPSRAEVEAFLAGRS